MAQTRLKQGTNEERLSVRLERKQKQLIEEAANITGQSLTSFAISTLTRSAQEIVERFGQTSLSNADRDLFLQILDADEEPNSALDEAVKNYRAKVA